MEMAKKSMGMSRLNSIIHLAEGWSIICAGIVKLRNKLEGVSNDEFSMNDYMNIHSTVYQMCITQKGVHNYSHQIYEKYRQFLEEHISGKVLPALSEEYDEFMLRAVLKWWKHYKDMIRYVSNMLSVVDQTLVRKKKLSSLCSMGFNCFRELVLRGYVKNAVMKVINRERDGEQIDRALLRNIVDLFVEIGMDSMDFYKKDFEAHVLEDTATYYSRNAALWISESSCPQYLVKAEECLKEEKDRVAHYLHSSTEHMLLEKVRNELLSPFYETQLLEMEDSGCHALLMAGKKNDLSRMYRLFCAMPKGLEPIANTFSQHITSQGTAVIRFLEDAINSAKDTHQGILQEHSASFVHQVMELHDTYMDFVRNAFEDNNLFGKALVQAFTVICNKEIAGISVAELLSTVCNTVLKRDDDDHIDSELEKVVKLVKYVGDKDVFSEFCREKLCRRLLFNNKKVNENHERSLLSKLKVLCGSQLTFKMEAMVNDFVLNQEMQATFHDISKQQNHLTIDFSPALLNKAMWPTYQRSQLNLPSEMLTCVEVFEHFYSTQNKNRKLTWIHSLGTCDIISHFDHKRIDMTVTTYQAATLLLFNDSQKLTYEDIKFLLNLPDEDVERLLHSLACRNHKILLKQPPIKTIAPHDTFEFNSAFTHKMARIKVPLPSLVNEKEKVTGTVEKDRKPAIEAAIVRIMKSRKALHHQQLLSECIQQLEGTFKPNIKSLEKGIKDLISRDFLRPDQQDPNIYIYVA